MRHLFFLAAIFLFTLTFTFTATASDVIYPALGYCTGDNVRLRDAPGTDSEIIGRVNSYNRLVILGERNFNGDLWYSIDNPKENGKAWIISRYVKLTGTDNERTPAAKIAINLRRDYGITPEKAKKLLGRPQKDTRGKFFFESANEELSEEILTYKGCELRYIENDLRHIEITSRQWSFDNFLFGDSQEKVLSKMGEPSDKENNTWSYEISPVEYIEFTFNENNIIIKMEWNEYFDA